MKALVTGGTGFIGGYLVERLAAEGHRVTVLARRSSDTVRVEELGARIVRGDLREREAVVRAAEGADRVFHLAATRSPASWMEREPDWAINVEGTAAVAEAAMAAGVARLVFASTVGVYGPVSDPPVTESTTPRPNSPYRRTKLEAERLLLDLHRREGFPAVVARLSKVAGPRSTSWLGLLQKISRPPFRMVGAGRNHVDVTHVSDIVDGLVRCARTPGAEGEVYLLSGREQVPLRSLVERLAEELGSTLARWSLPELPYRLRYGLVSWTHRRFGLEWRHYHPYELFLSDVVYDNELTRRELGYRPEVGAAEALLETADWYRRQGLLGDSPGSTP